MNKTKMLDKLTYISKLFQSQVSNVYIKDFNFYIKTTDTELINEIRLNDIDIDVENGRILLKLYNSSFINLFPFKELKLFETEFLNSSFIVLDNNGDYCYYCCENEKIIQFNENAEQKFKNICNNLISYFSLFIVITSLDFADHFNASKKEIVLFSSVNGIFKIEYESIPTLSEKEILIDPITELITLIRSIELKQFIKNSFFTFSNGTGKIELNHIFENADDIITASKRDYELVSKQFSFKNFKDSLYTEKEKYFAEIREIINKIFSQAVGIPISISATVFVTYKISNDNLILLMAFLAFLVYISFYVKIQLVYKSDLKEIEKNFTRDFETIKINSGLDIEIINQEKMKIERKINNSISIVNWLLISVILLGIILSFFIFYQIYKGEKTCLSTYIFYFFYKLSSSIL